MYIDETDLHLNSRQKYIVYIIFFCIFIIYFINRFNLLHVFTILNLQWTHQNIKKYRLYINYSVCLLNFQLQYIRVCVVLVRVFPPILKWSATPVLFCLPWNFSNWLIIHIVRKDGSSYRHAATVYVALTKEHLWCHSREFILENSRCLNSRFGGDSPYRTCVSK